MAALHKKLLCEAGIFADTEPQRGLRFSCSHEDHLHQGTVHLSIEVLSLPCPSLLGWQPYHKKVLSDQKSEEVARGPSGQLELPEAEMNLVVSHAFQSK